MQAGHTSAAGHAARTTARPTAAGCSSSTEASWCSRVTYDVRQSPGPAPPGQTRAADAARARGSATAGAAGEPLTQCHLLGGDARLEEVDRHGDGLQADERAKQRLQPARAAALQQEQNEGGAGDDDAA